MIAMSKIKNQTFNASSSKLQTRNYDKLNSNASNHTDCGIENIKVGDFILANQVNEFTDMYVVNGNLNYVTKVH